MNMAFELKATRLADIALQEASLNIWDTKYRLKTKAGLALDGEHLAKLARRWRPGAATLCTTTPGDSLARTFGRKLRLPPARS